MSKPNRHRHNQPYLDGEKLFRYYWTTMGTARSLGGVRRWCVTEGILNPNLGTPPSLMGIEKAMWRWAVRKENFELGYEIVQAAQRDEGNYMTREEWKEYLNDKIGIAYQNPERYDKRFRKKHGYEVQSSNPT